MEDDQQFCLKWNNHQSTLIQNFDTLLVSGTLVDCTLAAEGKYLKAHKVVLSACSPYFEGLLSEHYDKHPVFILKDVKFKELKAMMDYMYRGEVNVSQDQLTALLKAAESLQIKGLSDSRTGGTGGATTGKAETRTAKTASSTAASSSVDIPHASSGLTTEKNSKVPRQSLQQVSVSDLPEDSASPQLRGLSSREGSQSPTRKRKRLRRRSLGNEDTSNTLENHEASNSSDVNLSASALGVAPVADDSTHAEPADTISRSALMQQLTKPADEMLQIPIEKPEPSEEMLQPKSEYLDDQESVEDLTNLDDDMNDLTEMQEDNSRAGPSHDPSQHPAGIASWHMAGDRSNASVVGAGGGPPGGQDEVFLAAHEAAQAQRDSQVLENSSNIKVRNVTSISLEQMEQLHSGKLQHSVTIRKKPGRPRKMPPLMQVPEVELLKIRKVKPIAVEAKPLVNPASISKERAGKSSKAASPLPSSSDLKIIIKKKHGKYSKIKRRRDKLERNELPVVIKTEQSDEPASHTRKEIERNQPLVRIPKIEIGLMHEVGYSETNKKVMQSSSVAFDKKKSGRPTRAASDKVALNAKSTVIKKKRGRPLKQKAVLVPVIKEEIEPDSPPSPQPSTSTGVGTRRSSSTAENLLVKNPVAALQRKRGRPKKTSPSIVATKFDPTKFRQAEIKLTRVAVGSKSIFEMNDALQVTTNGGQFRTPTLPTKIRKKRRGRPPKKEYKKNEEIFNKIWKKKSGAAAKTIKKEELEEIGLEDLPSMEISDVDSGSASEPQTPKRKRGRPKLTKSNENSNLSDEYLNVSEDLRKLRLDSMENNLEYKAESNQDVPQPSTSKEPTLKNVDKESKIIESIIESESGNNENNDSEKKEKQIEQTENEAGKGHYETEQTENMAEHMTENMAEHMTENMTEQTENMTGQIENMSEQTENMTKQTENMTKQTENVTEQTEMPSKQEEMPPEQAENQTEDTASQSQPVDDSAPIVDQQTESEEAGEKIFDIKLY